MLLLLLSLHASNAVSIEKKKADCSVLAGDDCLTSDRKPLPTIVTYEGKDFNGRSSDHQVEADTCRSLDQPALSINTYGTCVQLFYSSDCSDDSDNILKPDDGFYFMDVSGPGDAPVRSFKGCAREEELFASASLYPQTQMQGEAQDVRVKAGECLDLQPETHVASIDTHETCVSLFEKPGCTGASIKVFPGASFPHTDLQSISFPTLPDTTVGSRVRSVAACVARLDELRWPAPRQAVVHLYSRPHFQGKGVTLDLKDEACHQLPAGFRVHSTDTKNNCVIFFAGAACEEGDSRRVFPGAQFPHTNLASVRMSSSARLLPLVARSLRRCKQP